MNTVIESILSRSTTSLFDQSADLSDDQVAELVRIATTAPTSFNFQNWRFVAVRSPAAKERLRALAWDQPKITDAAVTFIICGQLIDYTVLPDRLAPAVEASIMPQAMVSGWRDAAEGLYSEQPQRQRDEAVRSGAIGATALMYAAHALGLGAGPMIGFDAEAVAREFDLDEGEVPVMLVAVGAARPGNWPQKPRRPIGEVLTFV